VLGQSLDHINKNISNSLKDGSQLIWLRIEEKCSSKNVEEPLLSHHFAYNTLLEEFACHMHAKRAETLSGVALPYLPLNLT